MKKQNREEEIKDYLQKERKGKVSIKQSLGYIFALMTRTVAERATDALTRLGASSNMSTTSVTYHYITTIIMAPYSNTGVWTLWSTPHLVWTGRSQLTL